MQHATQRNEQQQAAERQQDHQQRHQPEMQQQHRVGGQWLQVEGKQADHEGLHRDDVGAHVGVEVADEGNRDQQGKHHAVDTAVEEAMIAEPDLTDPPGAGAERQGDAAIEAEGLHQQDQLPQRPDPGWIDKVAQVAGQHEEQSEMEGGAEYPGPAVGKESAAQKEYLTRKAHSTAGPTGIGRGFGHVDATRPGGADHQANGLYQQSEH